MAIQKKKSAESEAKTTYNVEVKRVKQFDSGDIAFDMEVNGIMIYGCIYKTINTDKGETSFISFPSRKAGEGKDAKYYNHVWFKVDSDTFNTIEKQIEGLL